VALGTHFGLLNLVSIWSQLFFWGSAWGKKLKKRYFGGDRFSDQLFGQSQGRLGGKSIAFAQEGLQKT